MWPPWLCETFLISFPAFIDRNLPKLMADAGMSYQWQAGGVLINVCGSPELMQGQLGLFHRHDKCPANRCSKPVKRVNPGATQAQRGEEKKRPAAGLCPDFHIEATVVTGRDRQPRAKRRAQKLSMFDPQMWCSFVKQCFARNVVIGALGNKMLFLESQDHSRHLEI